MLELIKNWIIANQDSLICNIVVTSMFWGLGKLWVLKNKVPKIIRTLASFKVTKYLILLVLYIFPIIVIISMIVDKTNEVNFKNIGLFIIICITLVYNILMSHIISIYKMFTELTSKCSDNDLAHKKAINILFESVGRKERIE